MGFGNTAKKVQKLADVAEKTYSRLNDLREQVSALRSTVEDTGDRVETLEHEVARQRAVLDAIAEDHGLDPQALAEDAAVDDATDDRSAESPPSEA